MVKILGLEIEVPDFLASYIPDPIQRYIAYGIFYVLMALLISYALKSKLRIWKPKNIFNFLALGAGAVLVFLQVGLIDEARFLVIGGFIIADFLGFKLFPLKTSMLYIIESDKRNVMVDEMIFYTEDGTLYVALQDNRSAIKRIIFGQKVIVETNGSTSWTEDYELQLYICNHYEIFEKTVEPVESVEEGLRTKLHNWFFKNKQIVMKLDLCEAHILSRWDLIQKTQILDFAVEKLEKVELAYTKLRTLLTAMLVKKHQKVIVSALKTFEDAIFISKEERLRIKGIHEELNKEKKDIDTKTADIKKPSRSEARSEVEYT